MGRLVLILLLPAAIVGICFWTWVLLAHPERVQTAEAEAALLRGVQTAAARAPAAVQTTEVLKQEDKPCPEVRVVVLISPVDPQSHDKRAAAIRETWGAGGVSYGLDRACINLGTTIVKTPQPAIEDTGQWLKALLAEFKAHPNLSWLLKVEDTAGLLPGRLATFLNRYNPSDPQLLGNQLQTAWAPHHRYLSGAGFAISAEAIRRVRDGGGISLVPDGLQKVPDVGFATICRKLGAQFPDTRDSKGGERFNVFPPHVCAHGAYHQWYVDYKREAGQPVLQGTACCAADSFLFQYIGAEEQRTLAGLFDDSKHDVPAGFRWACPCLFDRWGDLKGKDSGVERALFQKLLGSATASQET